MLYTGSGGTRRKFINIANYTHFQEFQQQIPETWLFPWLQRWRDSEQMAFCLVNYDLITRLLYLLHA